MACIDSLGIVAWSMHRSSGVGAHREYDGQSAGILFLFFGRGTLLYFCPCSPFSTVTNSISQCIRSRHPPVRDPPCVNRPFFPIPSLFALWSSSSSPGRLPRACRVSSRLGVGGVNGWKNRW
ncbi:unnamed protein product, partial [Discosporangium mesarthrocarpum]